MNSYLQRLKEKTTNVPTLGTDRTDKGPSVSSVGSEGSHFSENANSVLVGYRTGGASCDLAVLGSNVVSFAAEVRRRGLIRFRLKGDDGGMLPGFSLESPGPDEDRAQCIKRLRTEFGARLVLDSDEGGSEVRNGR